MLSVTGVRRGLCPIQSLRDPGSFHLGAVPLAMSLELAPFGQWLGKEGTEDGMGGFQGPGQAWKPGVAPMPTIE